MGVKFEIKAKTGEDKNGKAFYARIGVVLQNDKGFSMKLNTIPLGWDGFAFFSEPEARQEPRQEQVKSNSRPARNGYSQSPQVKDDFDEDIPF